MKKALFLFVAIVGLFLLSACWPGELAVETELNQNGGGKRTYIIDIMDDLLSETVIPNPDDPDGSKGNGPVLNDKYTHGGVLAINTWLEENAPDYVTVLEPRVEGYHRYFGFSFEFKDFDEFLEIYEKLVDLSPTLSWSDFSAAERPSLVITGGSTKTITFKESDEIILASLDWALSGIFDNVIDQADLAGFFDKGDIMNLAKYKVTIGKEIVLDEESAYDPDVDLGDGKFGKVVYFSDELFESTGTIKGDNSLVITLIIVGVAVVVAAAGLGTFFVIKKRKSA